MSFAISTPANLMMLQGSPTGPDSTAAMAARKDRIAESAKEFESSFLSMMLKPMFEGLKTDGPFGGGDAENMWRSFLTDALAKQTTKAGGIGLADTVQREMLKMQGLSTEGNAHGA